jgi:hypothetical protein
VSSRRPDRLGRRSCEPLEGTGADEDRPQRGTGVVRADSLRALFRVSRERAAAKRTVEIKDRPEEAKWLRNSRRPT